MNSLQRLADSILAADIGQVWTRVILLERIAGRLRPVARSDVPTTHRDVSVGVRTALEKIETSTGRHFFDDEGDLITPESMAGGIDRFLVTTSAAPPLRVALLALAQQVSLASARRAVHGTYSEIITAIALDAAGGRWGGATGIAGLAHRLSDPWPHLFVLTGGMEGSADRDLLEATDAVRLAITARDPSRALPSVLYAGNSALSDEVEARIGTEAPLLISDNVRPTMRDERLRTTARLVENRYMQEQVATLPGGAQLALWASSPILSTAAALSRVVQYLALRHDQRVLGIDVGGGSVTIASALPDHGTMTVVRTDLGVARGEQLIQAIGEERVSGWLPSGPTVSEALNQYLSSITPATQIPDSRESLLLLQGIARAAVVDALAEASERWPRPFEGLSPPLDVVLGTGATIAQAPRPAQALGLLVDAVQPIGVVRFYRDLQQIAPLIGILAENSPQAAASLIENEGFELLATVITPIGRGRPGETWVSFRYEQGNSVTEGTVEGGEIFVLPLLGPTTLTIKPSGGMDLGQGPGKSLTLQSHNEQVGFVIDARGRPLVTESDVTVRRDQLTEWMTNVGA